MADESYESSLCNLPRDMQLYMLSFLPFSSLGSILLLSPDWNALGKDNVLWERIFKIHFLPLYAAAKKNKKELYAADTGYWYKKFVETYAELTCNSGIPT